MPQGEKKFLRVLRAAVHSEEVADYHEPERDC